ncbi:MAG: T9SS type A sorting domain-containing protein, partial [Polaribacter sp.]
LISEIEDVANTVNANTLLGLHRVGITTRVTALGGSWDNGYPDRSRFVVIDEDYNHTSSRLSARKLTVNTSKKLSVTDNLLVVTKDVVLNGEIRLINPAMDGAAQLIQTHKSASLVTGTGKLLVDQNSTVPSKYRYNYIGSPVKNSAGASSYTVASILKDATVPSNNTGVVNANTSTGIAKDINWISGYDGNFTNSPSNAISLANYWIYTYASNEGKRSTWSQKFSYGQIPNADGFIFKGPGRLQNYTFLGIPKDGEVTTVVGKDESYLVANPYASAISVKEFIEDNNNSISGTIYFWEHAGEQSSSQGSEGHNFAGYIGGYASRTIAMGVTAKNAAGGAVDTNLQAETSTIVGGVIESVLEEQSNIDVVKLDSIGKSITFNNIASGVDTLRIKYKSSATKVIRLKVNSGVRGEFDFEATGDEFVIGEIILCVEPRDNITFESIDDTEIQIDYLNLKDDGEISCAPNLGGEGITYTEPKPYIAIGQGFFVQGDGINGGVVEFNNSQREYILEGTDAVFFKSSGKSNPNSIKNLPVIKLGMNFNNTENDNNLFHRQIGISFSQYTSFSYDKGYDAEIYDIGSTDFYWKFPEDDKNYVISGVQAISNDLEVPLEITMGYSGNITIKVDEMKNVNNNVYITDKVTGVSYEIVNGNANLSLDQGVYSDRFVLAFKPSTALSLDDNDSLANRYTNIYADNTDKTLVISKNEEVIINDVELYSILGKKVGLWKTKEQKQSYKLKIKKQLPTGVYIVKINTDKGEINKKIIVE